MGALAPAGCSGHEIRDGDGLRTVRTDRAGILVGFDTEITTIEPDAFVIDSYRFAVPDTVDLRSWSIPLNERHISLHTALWEVVFVAEPRQSPLVLDGVDERRVGRHLVLDGSPPGTVKAAAMAWAEAGGLVAFLPFRLQQGDGEGDWYVHRMLSMPVGAIPGDADRLSYQSDPGPPQCGRRHRGSAPQTTLLNERS